MKSIHQKCQLSDKELKAVLAGDGASFGELMDQAMDYSHIQEDISMRMLMNAVFRR